MKSRMEDLEESFATGPDEWGRDPAVRAMRRVFAAMVIATAAYVAWRSLA